MILAMFACLIAADRVAGASPVPSEASVLQRVAPPAPGPEGILPCAERRIVLTAAYRYGNVVRFEGVARYSMRGWLVRITSGGEVIALTKVRQDGTFWGWAPDRSGRRFPPHTHFRAHSGDNRSWARRLSQAVTIRDRGTWGDGHRGDRPGIEIEVPGGSRELTLTRQTGCHKREAKPVKRFAASREGLSETTLPRPGNGRPYAIYRIQTADGKMISSPIVVRSGL